MQVTRNKLQNARLNPGEVPGIRHRVKSGATTTMFEADRYGVGVETIRRAVRGETFRNVKEGLVEPDFDEIPLDVSPEEVEASLKRLSSLISPTEATSPVDAFLNAREKEKK